MIVEVGDINWYEYLSGFGLVTDVKKQRRKTEKQRILNVFAAFDIETSTVWCNEDHSLYDVHSFMYTWQFQLEEYTVKGRTWEEFFTWLHTVQTSIEQIGTDNGLSNPPLMVIWVHNLAFEWTFLSGLYPFTNEECFFRDVRKPIYCRMFNVFEYRCSYIQTNLSLAALCKQTGVEMKLSGQEFDYNKVRFPWTKLTEFEEEIERNNYIEAVAEKYHISIESLRKLVAKTAIKIGQATPATKPKQASGHERGKEDGNLQSQKILLTWLIENEQIFKQIKKYITPHDFKRIVG